MIPKEYNLAGRVSGSFTFKLMILGFVFLLGAIVSSWVSDSLKGYFHSYLFSFSFYMSIVFGSIFFVILQHLTRSSWSVVVRRVAETFMKNIELMVILSLPVLFGVFHLYEWTHPDEVAADHLLRAKAPYLNLGFFFIRVIFYFICIFILSNFYYRLSVFQDRNGDLRNTLKLQKFAPLSTVVYAIVITFFSFDFLMTLNPHWYSTIWGVYYFAGSFIASLVMIILVLLVLRRMGFLRDVVTIEHFHDLGKLLFSFNIFWSYVVFSQYMLIWYANIPEETIFYIDRINGSWLNVSWLLLVGHVFLPSIVFISRNAKRNIKIQLVVAMWFFFIHMVDLYWVVMPNVDRRGINVTWVDFLNFFGLGLLFVGYFLRNFIKESIIPLKDPRLESSIRFENR